MNTVTLRGYVAQDSLVHTMKNNKQYLNFTLGHNITFKNERGNIEKKVNFFDVSLYGNYAGAINSLKKGTLIYLEGKLTQNSWEKDGKKYSKVGIIAKKIYISNKTQTQDSQQIAPQDIPKQESKLTIQEIQEIIAN